MRTGRVSLVGGGGTFQLEEGTWIRLAGVHAPELDEPNGRVVRKKLEDLVHQREIRYELVGSSEAGAREAEVWVGSTHVNAAMRRFVREVTAP